MHAAPRILETLTSQEGRQDDPWAIFCNETGPPRKALSGFARLQVLLGKLPRRVHQPQAVRGVTHRGNVRIPST